MIFANALINEIKKDTGSPAFLVSAAAAALLCSASGIYTEPSGERTYSVIECIFTFDSGLIKSSYMFSSIMVFLRGTNEYLFMFMPVLAAVPYVRAFDSGMEGAFYRYEMFRSGKKAIVISKFLGGIISGGLAALFGTVMYGLAVFALFPDFGSYNVDEGMEGMQFFGSLGAVILKRLAGMFLFGMFQAVLPVMLSALIRNAYVVLCLPFMINYLYSMALNKISLSENVLNTKAFDQIGLLYPQAVLRLFENPAALFINLISAAAAFFVYAAALTRKADLQ